MAETDARPVRMCDSCGGVDDHPRHTVWWGPTNASPTTDEVAEIALKNAGDNVGEILRQIRDTETVVKHMDCCREDGCPDGTCDQVTAGAEDLRGNDLLAHLIKEG